MTEITIAQPKKTNNCAFNKNQFPRAELNIASRRTKKNR